MKKFCRVLAVILAVLMLITMATACKKSDEDEWDEIVSGDDSFNDDDSGNGDDGDDSDQDSVSDKDSDSDKDQDSGKDKGPDKDQDSDKDKDSDQDSDSDKDSDSDNKKEPASIDKVIEEYDASKKYDVESNPLLAESKKPNTGIGVSFDIDTTGFVKNNIKLADLKGKTFTLITAIKYGSFQYKGPNGEQLNEWTWFEALKDEYGVNVKYIESRFTEAVAQALTYMNAGKALDIIPTHIGGFPMYLNLSQPVDPYINLQNIGNSPGVDEMTLKQTRYGGGYRCISPIGCVDVLWYDQSRVEELNLVDPHTLYKQDKWDWDAWRSFIQSAPKTSSSGLRLSACSISTIEATWAWPLTDGVNTIELDTKSDKMNIINNWDDERVIRAITYFSEAYKSVTNGADSGDGGGGVIYEGTVLMGETVVLMNNYDTYEPYAMNHKVNWVPYPKSPYEGGRYVAYNFGYTMMVPKKVKNQSNIPYAVKFMELWATRYTEAMFDYLATAKFLQFNYQQRKEYFEFCIKNTYFGLQMNSWRFLGDADKAAMLDTNSGYFYALSNRNLNVATLHSKVSNVVAKAIQECIDYAQ